MLEAATGDVVPDVPDVPDVPPAPSGGLPRGPEPDGAFPGW
jgi:hypothetical protein